MAEIEQPDFDELTIFPADVEELGEGIIEDARLDGISQLASTPATYWLTLRAAGIPPKECTAITVEWMGICAWPQPEE